MAWCTISEIEHELSVDGVTGTTNDNQVSRVGDPAIVANAIEIAQEQLSQYLVTKYDTSTITSANKWVKWATATFAAVELLRRKGGTASAGLQEKYEELREFLTGVQTGTLIVPGLTARQISGIQVTNYTLDRTYGRTKVRRVPSISYPSTGSSLSQFNENNDFGTH